MTVKKTCIARDCGKLFNPDVPETRPVRDLRSFWQRYCPECRTKGNAGSADIVGVVEAVLEVNRPQPKARKKVSIFGPVEVQTFLNHAREHACYGENTKAARDAEWLILNARAIVRAEYLHDEPYVRELKWQRQQRLGKLPAPPDFILQNEGTIFILIPQTTRASAWLDAHIPAEAQWFGTGVVVEHRYIADIVDGIRAAGLTVASR
jgi:hypothetical protein